MTFSVRVLEATFLVYFLTGMATGENRSIDGTGNNALYPDWGMAGARFARLAPPEYEDGISQPKVITMPNARMVSNLVCRASGAGGNAYGLSSFVWQWGQFIDHDISLSRGLKDSNEAFHIEVNTDDPLAPMIPLMRTEYDPVTGNTSDSPREQMNSITSYLDASMVYGSDEARASWLRTGVGGRLKVHHSNGSELLPLNLAEFPNANDVGAPEQSLFLAGDVRCNEQLGLIAIHTVFMREHNRLVDELAAEKPDWTDEQIYQRARKLVGAMVQVVTYQEFLPSLLGPRAPEIATFQYDSSQTAAISNEFAAAIYRIGHTMVPEQLLLMNDDGAPATEGSILVADAFFTPATIIENPGKIEHLLKGLSMQQQENVDARLVDSFRNQLFGAAGAGGLDLAALNIQRGRDHGLASYNAVRLAVGLDAKTSIDAITTDPATRSNLAATYTNVDQIDLWVGTLSEDHLPGAAVGELAAAAIAQQFSRLAEGDRFFFMFDPELNDVRDELMATRLCDIILRNSTLNNMQTNVFIIPEHDQSETEYALNLETGDITLSTTILPGRFYSLQRSIGLAQWNTIASGLTGDEKVSSTDKGALNAFESVYYRFIEE